MNAPDFDWSRENCNVVLRAYGSVAVHESLYGDVVIRQERDARATQLVGELRRKLDSSSTGKRSLERVTYRPTRRKF